MLSFCCIALVALLILALHSPPASSAANYCTSSMLEQFHSTTFIDPSSIPYHLTSPSVDACHALCCSVAGCLAFSLSSLPTPPSSQTFPCHLHQTIPTAPSPHPNSTFALIHITASPPTTTPITHNLTLPSTLLLDQRLLPYPLWSAPECLTGCLALLGCLAAVGSPASPGLLHCRAVSFFTALTPDLSDAQTVFLNPRSNPQPTPLAPPSSPTPTPTPHSLASPIRGWNTYDSYGSTPTESEILLNALSLQRHLAPSGYRLISLDWGWWLSMDGQNTIDELGRFQPGPDRFPSSKGGVGFGPLSERLHGMGLLLGIYTNAGFSIAFNNTGPHHIPNLTQCVWPGNNYFLDWQDSDAQRWLDGTVQQWADWGVDYVNTSITRPHSPYRIPTLHYCLTCNTPLALSRLSLLGSGEG